MKKQTILINVQQRGILNLQSALAPTEFKSPRREYYDDLDDAMQKRVDSSQEIKGSRAGIIGGATVGSLLARRLKRSKLVGGLAGAAVLGTIGGRIGSHIRKEKKPAQ